MANQLHPRHDRATAREAQRSSASRTVIHGSAFPVFLDSATAIESAYVTITPGICKRARQQLERRDRIGRRSRRASALIRPAGTSSPSRLAGPDVNQTAPFLDCGLNRPIDNCRGHARYRHRFVVAPARHGHHVRAVEKRARRADCDLASEDTSMPLGRRSDGDKLVISALSGKTKSSCARMGRRRLTPPRLNRLVGSLAQPAIVAINLLMLLVWILVVTRAWVKRAAMLYAERLLETLDALA